MNNQHKRIVILLQILVVITSVLVSWIITSIIIWNLGYGSFGGPYRFQTRWEYALGSLDSNVSSLFFWVIFYSIFMITRLSIQFVLSLASKNVQISHSRKYYLIELLILILGALTFNVLVIIYKYLSYPNIEIMPLISG